MLAAIETLHASGSLATYESAETLLEALRARVGDEKAHVRLKDAAAAFGTAVHSEIERDLRRDLGLPLGRRKDHSQTLTPEAYEQAKLTFEHYREWKARHNYRPLFIEKFVYSLAHEFAGTMDVLGVITACDDKACCDTFEGEAVVITDWKSSAGIYLTACMQASAYREAVLELGLHMSPLHGLIVRLPKKLGDTKVEPRFIPESEMVKTYFPAFLAAKKLFETSLAYDERYPWKKTA